MSEAFQETEVKKDTVKNELVLTPQGNGLAITGLILGILSVALNLIPFLPYLLGLLAVIFSPLGLKSEKRNLAIAGLVLGILSFAMKIGFWILSVTSLLFG